MLHIIECDKANCAQADADEEEYEDILPEALTSKDVDIATKEDILRQFAHWSDEEADEPGDDEDEEGVSMEELQEPESEPENGEILEEKMSIDTGNALENPLSGDDNDEHLNDIPDAIPLPENAEIITYGRKRGVILDDVDFGDDAPSSDAVDQVAEDAVSSDGNQKEPETTYRSSEAKVLESLPPQAHVESNTAKNPYDKNMNYRLQLLREERAARRSKVLIITFLFNRR